MPFKSGSLNDSVKLGRFYKLAVNEIDNKESEKDQQITQRIVDVPVFRDVEVIRPRLGKFIFLEDTAAIAQCEIAYITDCGADA